MTLLQDSYCAMCLLIKIILTYISHMTHILKYSHYKNNSAPFENLNLDYFNIFFIIIIYYYFNI